MAVKIINFTKSLISTLPSPKTGRDYYKDSKEKGLALYVTNNGAKSFYLRKRINGKDEKIIIGSFPEISVENARKHALRIKSKVAEGKNPVEQKQALKQEITFKELFQEYMERYSRKEKKSWKYDEREVNRFLSHWFSRKISIISKHEVQLLHEKTRDNNGLYQANRLLERIRAIYNKAIEWGFKGENPTKGIKKFREKSRDRFILPDEIPKFFKALNEETNIIARDYILSSLLTGARKSNVLAMRWEEINFSAKTWRIPETKNGEAVIIALTGQAIEVLERRKEENAKLEMNDKGFVFPSKSASGHLADPKKAWRRVLNRAGIVDLRLHDIRRTLGSYQAITGASLQVIGKSLGHKSGQATQIYSRLHLDPVRDSLTKATDAIFSLAAKLEN